MDAINDRERIAGNRASEATKLKIILAAEQLFAREGIDGASFREIATTAGLKNTNAVRYHFGTRENLMRAVFEYYTARFDPMRTEMLALAERTTRLKDLHTLLEILLLPYLHETNDSGRHLYAGFMAQYLIIAKPETFNFPYDDITAPIPALRRLLLLISDRLSFLPEHILQHRIRTSVRIFASSVVRWDNDRDAGVQMISLEDLTKDTIMYVHSGLITPYRHSDDNIFSEYFPKY